MPRRQRFGRIPDKENVPEIARQAIIKTRKTISSIHIFTDIVKQIIETLPCSDKEKMSLYEKLEKYKYDFPEYCQSFANETIDDDEPDDVWLSAVYPLVLSIRDKTDEIN